MSCDSIRIAGVHKESIVDGPGIRFAIFSQGCAHNCEGCHNPETHDFEGGYDCSISRILEEIDKNPLLDGVTFSGGDPIYQAEAFLALAKEIKLRNLNILLYTGFTYEELQVLGKENPAIMGLLEYIDYLIDGRYDANKRDLTLDFMGSSNQRFIDMNSTRKESKIVIYKN